MTEHQNELEKLGAIAKDLDLASDLRIKAIQQIGRIGTHEALLALLDLVANERLVREEREIALKQARDIVRAGH